MLAAEVLFPAATNWYAAHALDALPNGTVVLATNQAITVVDGTTRRVLAVCGQRGRVTGVGLGDGVLCACTADRGVWALDATSLTNIGSHKEHPAEPCSLLIVGRICVTGDKKGSLCLWALPGSSSGASVPAGQRAVERLCPHREPVLCLAATTAGSTGTSSGARIAAGYNSGTVALVDLVSQTVISSFRHRAAVQGLSWTDGAGGDGSGAYAFLATSCQDQTVQLWRVDAHGQADICEQVSGASGRQERFEGKAWISVHAISQTSVLFSGARGELFAWDASREKKKGPQRAAPVHTRPIFGIRPVGTEHIVTAAMDRLVVLWSLDKAVPQMKWRLCCLGGHITSVRTDGANIACFGCGDGSLRVVDLLHPEHRQHCWVAWRGLMSPVTGLAPGPVRSIWAYGLQDGSFGLLPIHPVEGPGAVEPQSSTNHPAAVTSLCWLRAASSTGKAQQAGSSAPDQATESVGPANKEMAIPETAEAVGEPAPNNRTQSGKGRGKKNAAEKKKEASKDAFDLPRGTVLVSVSGGQQALATLLEHSCARIPPSTAIRAEPVSGIAAVPLAACSWVVPEGDVLVMAVTHRARDDNLEAHSLQLFHAVAAEAAANMQCISVLRAEGLDGEVTSMSVCDRVNSQKASCWVLCGSAKGSLAVLCLTWPPPPWKPDGGPAQWPTHAHIRQAHSKPITDVQWRTSVSTEDTATCLTASQDGALKVWGLRGEAMELQCLHVLNGFLQRSSSGVLLAACWDVSAGGDALALLSGGRDQIGFRWEPEKSALAGPAQHSQKLGADAAIPSSTIKPAATASAPSRSAKQSTKKVASLLALASSAVYQQSSKARALDLVRLIPSALELWPGEEKLAAMNGMAPASLSAAIFTNCQAHADWWLDSELENKIGSAPEDRASALQRARLLKLWATDVQEAICFEMGDEPVGQSNAGDFLAPSWLWAALSPSAGPGVWEAAMGKLIAGDSVHHAVAAALALERADEAVRIYLRAEMMAEALLLARLRFPSRHPLIAFVYEQWAADFKRRGRHDQAGACHIACGQLGLALADLEEWLTPSGPLPVTSDPVRLAGSFVAAHIAEAVATSQLQAASASAADIVEAFGEVLAYDHRHWWGHQGLRLAVKARKRCLIEVLHSGRFEQALTFVRLEVKERALSKGEGFLRTVFVGYASAVAWWLQFQNLEDEVPASSSELSNVTCPLQSFCASGQNAVAPEGDWDFEWRALTWLPAYETRSEDPLLAAAVELGRACASLASGATRSASENDAPWDSLASAVNALIGANNLAVTAKHLSRMAHLAQQPQGSPGARSFGKCIAATVKLLHPLPDGGDEQSDPWQILSNALFGLPTAAGGSVAAEALRRGHCLLSLCHQERTPSAIIRRIASLVSAGVLPKHKWETIGGELEGKLRDLADACGLLVPASAKDGQAQAGAESSTSLEALQRARSVHTLCLSPLLVPMYLATWSERLLIEAKASPTVQKAADAPAEYAAADEYEAVGNEADGATAQAWASLLGAFADFAAEAEAEADADDAWEIDANSLKLPEEAEALNGVLRLEPLPHLSLAQRLTALRGMFSRASRGEALTGSSTALAQASAVYELLAGLMVDRTSGS